MNAYGTKPDARCGEPHSLKLNFFTGKRIGTSVGRTTEALLYKDCFINMNWMISSMLKASQTEPSSGFRTGTQRNEPRSLQNFEGLYFVAAILVRRTRRWENQRYYCIDSATLKKKQEEGKILQSRFLLTVADAQSRSNQQDRFIDTQTRILGSSFTSGYAFVRFVSRALKSVQYLGESLH